MGVRGGFSQKGGASKEADTCTLYREPRSQDGVCIGGITLYRAAEKQSMSFANIPYIKTYLTKPSFIGKDMTIPRYKYMNLTANV